MTTAGAAGAGGRARDNRGCGNAEHLAARRGCARVVGLVVLVVALALAGSGGALFKVRNGRMRPIAGAEAAAETGADDQRTTLSALVPTPGERATLLQFSSAFCAPCRVTKRILADVAAAVPGVVHVEIDAESHLEAVRALAVRRTPTTLILGADLGVLARASGAPKRDEVMASLASAVDRTSEGR